MDMSCPSHQSHNQLHPARRPSQVRPHTTPHRLPLTRRHMALVALSTSAAASQFRFPSSYAWKGCMVFMGIVQESGTCQSKGEKMGGSIAPTQINTYIPTHSHCPHNDIYAYTHAPTHSHLRVVPGVGHGLVPRRVLGVKDLLQPRVFQQRRRVVPPLLLVYMCVRARVVMYSGGARMRAWSRAQGPGPVLNPRTTRHPIHRQESTHLHHPIHTHT